MHHDTFFVYVQHSPFFFFLFPLLFRFQTTATWRPVYNVRTRFHVGFSSWGSLHIDHFAPPSRASISHDVSRDNNQGLTRKEKTIIRAFRTFRLIVVISLIPRVPFPCDPGEKYARPVFSLLSSTLARVTLAFVFSLGHPRRAL